jgi:hypothetical protein
VLVASSLACCQAGCKCWCCWWLLVVLQAYLRTSHCTDNATTTRLHLRSGRQQPRGGGCSQDVTYNMQGVQGR